MPAPTPIPALVLTLARAVEAQGGRAYLVGGWVRDRALGLPNKDIDVEVHGLPEAALHTLLLGLGKVNAVGRSFGVYKLKARDEELDVSLPRRDSKVGPGHRGIAVDGDPFMGIDAATRRRDLTLNAMLYDPLRDEIVDLHGGMHDLRQRRLREVDPATFLEDPLRALRVVQFAARFGFRPTDGLIALCRQAPVGELPAERIRGELEKLLLKAARPGPGVLLLTETGLAERVLPELAPSIDPALAAVVDRAAAAARGSDAERLSLLYAALLHRLSPAQAERALDRLEVFTLNRVPVRARILRALTLLKSPVSPPLTPYDDPALRRLADELPMPLLLGLRAAVDPSLPDEPARARVLGVWAGPLPRLVNGADVAALGIAPGPRTGALLGLVRNAQHAGRVSTREDALALLASSRGPDDPPLY